ncbi:oligopeptide:H+ symporter [Streptomyces sp. ADMS]|uniref:peptide MFS transporter n=1 Tax=Streptomyces sp. ADMS TaxID=3071415 RepID=UPI00296FE6C6|nr:oligopeptide:H+ symporter [Streptomyces sp. ADMS]MDW4905899.1 oligopeptide:H+ symporter [Streptomyces sp. ADMS]
MSGRTGFLGQPRWFGTLFVVDLWERFSFYGMLAILYLYLVADPHDGGLGMTEGDAAALSGLYMSLVFMSALPGGWLTDRVFGARRATLYGGLLITAGHLLLAVPADGWLYPGLGLVVAGSGLVKPGMASMVGRMYGGQPERREAAFSLFYMSIQVSALLAPLITGFLGETVHWHLGFGAAALGMVVGVICYAVGWSGFGEVGARPERPLPAGELRPVLRRTGLYGALPALLVLTGAVTDVLGLRQVLMLAGLAVLTTPVLYFRALLRAPEIGPAERGRLRALRWMLLASSGFWLLFAQGPALLNLFARDSVDRVVGGWTVPASWFQSVQPLFLLLLSPIAAGLWLRLGRRAGAPAKFAAGLLLGGGAFVVMAAAASAASSGAVSPLWLIAVYLLLVCGELAVAPIGLSLAAEVAPPGFTGRMLGLFWLFAAVGAASGGQLARLADVVPEPLYYLVLSLVGLVVGVALTVRGGSLKGRLAGAREGARDTTYDGTGAPRKAPVTPNHPNK